MIGPVIKGGGVMTWGGGNCEQVSIIPSKLFLNRICYKFYFTCMVIKGECNSPNKALFFFCPLGNFFCFGI